MRSIRKKLPESSDIIKQRAKELRKTMTDAENKLQSRLRAKRIDAKFRRQEPIGNYIVDFVCIEKGLIVEIDGSQHYEEKTKKYDSKRDEFLKSLGFSVLRFSNLDVLKDIESVLSVIWDEVHPPLSPPRKAGGSENRK